MKPRELAKKVILPVLRKEKWLRRFRTLKRVDGCPVITPDQETFLYDAINLDTTNVCNQRCRFCFDVFSDKHYRMKPEQFAQAISALPLVKNYGKGGTGLYLSCLYEPTMNPAFLDLLEQLPTEARRKCFFTTNFSRPMDENYVKRLLSANVHHINISIETLQADRFALITQNRNFDSFRKNLALLEKLYPEQKGYRPKLRFITMILKTNVDEVCDLVCFCHDHLHASRHELRTPYISLYENMEWNRSQLMDSAQCEEIRSKLAALHMPMDVDIKSVSELELFDEAMAQQSATAEKAAVAETPDSESAVPESGVQESAAPEKLADIHALLSACYYNPEYFFLRINADGSVVENAAKGKMQLPETGAEAMFREHVKSLYQRKADACRIENLADTPGGVEQKLHSMLAWIQLQRILVISNIRVGAVQA